MLELQSSLYVGEYKHNLDAKNRLTIPSKWRFAGEAEASFLALPNPIGCITIYPPKMVAKLGERVAEVGLGNKRGQKALTRLFAKADQISTDKQGRITVIDKLIEHSGIKKTGVLVGNFLTFSLWAPERYQDYMLNDDEEEDEMAQILTELGL